VELRNHIANLGATVPEVVRAIGGGSAFVLLVYYAARCGRSGYCNATQAEIASDLEMDERHVRRAKAALVEAGAIVSTVSAGGGGRDRAHVTVVMGWCGESGRGAEFAPRGGVENAPRGGAPDALQGGAEFAPRGGTPTRARIKTRPIQDPLQDPPQESRAPREQGRGTTSPAQPLLWGGDKLALNFGIFAWAASEDGIIVAFTEQPPADLLAHMKAAGCRYKAAVSVRNLEDPWGPYVDRPAWVNERPTAAQLQAVVSIRE